MESTRDLRSIQPDPSRATRLRAAAMVIGYACAVVSVLVFSKAIWGRLVDDNYITLRYALNLARGNGLVYNLGESHLGTSGPLWAIVIGFLAWLGGLFGQDPHRTIPDIVQIGNAVALMATSAGLIHLFASRGRPVWGLAAGIIYPWVSLVYYGYAFEVIPQLATVVWAYHLFLRAQDSQKPAYGSAVLLCGATALRPDGVIWFLPVLAHHAYSHWSSSGASFPIRVRGVVPWKELILCCVLLGTFAGLFWVLSGQVIPSTYAAKHAQAVSRGMVDGTPGWEGFGLHLVNLIADILRWTPFVLFQVVLGFAALGLALVSLEIKRGAHALAILLGGCVIYVTIYALKLPGYTWYAVPVGLGLTVLAGLGVSKLVEVIWARNKVVASAVACILAWYAWVLIGKEEQLVQKHTQLFAAIPRIKTYEAFGKWLNKHARKGDSVGLVEVGIIGWFAPDVRVVDQLMLVSPGDVSSITRKNFSKAFQDARPEYIVQSWQVFEAMDNRPWFKKEYEFETGFSLEGMRDEPLSAEEAPKLDRNKVIVLDVWRRKPNLAAAKSGD